MRAGKYRRGGLAAQLLERGQCVRERRQATGAGLDVAADERPVLVEGPLAAVVLLERELNLRTRLDLLRQQGEAREPEETQRTIKVRGAYGHAYPYAVSGPSPAWQLGHQ